MFQRNYYFSPGVPFFQIPDGRRDLTQPVTLVDDRCYPSGLHANDVRCASHVVPVKWIHGSRADFYQDFIVPSGRLFNLFTLENIGEPELRYTTAFMWIVLRIYYHGAAAVNGCGFAPMIRSHSISAISPKRAGTAMR